VDTGVLATTLTPLDLQVYKPVMLKQYNYLHMNSYAFGIKIT